MALTNEEIAEFSEALGTMANSLKVACDNAEENPAYAWFILGGVSVALKRLSLDLKEANPNESE